MKKEILRQENWIWVAFIAALLAMAGSLQASNVWGWVPCELCWYQRILMYPLVLILFIAGVKQDKAVAQYVLLTSLIGMSVGIYHYLLQLGVVVPSGTCGVEAVSCAILDHMWLGFITLPLLSAFAFLVIAVAMWRLKRI